MVETINTAKRFWTLVSKIKSYRYSIAKYLNTFESQLWHGWCGTLRLSLVNLKKLGFIAANMYINHLKYYRTEKGKRENCNTYLAL